MWMGKTALITGVTGQDGAYLSRFLLERGYRVVGGQRRSSSLNTSRLSFLGVADDIEIVDIDLVEHANVMRTIEDVQPDEIYNLAAQSFVGASYEQPVYTADVDALGVTRILEAIRVINPKIRFYQASSSEMFGPARAAVQDEQSPFQPRSPYGIAKLYAHWITLSYRETWGVHACSGILFNHESPLRGRHFVTRKITSELAMLKHGRREAMTLGNIDARRDWGFAGDYVEGMWRMLQAETAGSYVLATGQARSVREFAQVAAQHLGFDLVWQGSGLDERGVDRKTNRTLIKIDPKFYRPADTHTLVGSPARAEDELGWRRKLSFEDMVGAMAIADDKQARDFAPAF
jgi:GDPmannose 4,6-dehydratase